MANILLGQIKKQTSSFLHEKFKTARMMFTDVTPAELLAEEATNNDPCTPDAKTMTRIAEASYEVEDYWRIVDVLHRRLYDNDWKQWRQSYKALVLLEFLLTHGPEEFAEEFLCDFYIIKDLSTFEHKDAKGFDWGNHMQKKSERILALLKGGETLKQARLKALKVTNEIQGFGNLMISPASSSSSPSPSSSRTSSSFASYSTTSSTWNDFDAFSKYEFSKELGGAIFEGNYSQGGIDEEKSNAILNDKNNVQGSHIWDSCASNEEKGSLLDYEEREEKEEEEEENDEDDDVNCYVNYNKPCGFFGRMRSKLGGRKGDFRSLSDVDKVNERKMVRQFSTKY